MNYFKTFTYLVVLNLALLVMIRCGGKGSSNSDLAPQFQIKGNFNSKVISSSSRISKIADASNAVKVIVFDTNGDYNISDITNGSFSISTDKNYPVGMIFIGTSDEYLGYLDLGNGIQSMPLSNVEDTTTIIDLQTLTVSGNVVTPGHNPLGDELGLTAGDQAALSHCNGMFASTVRNPDIDGNGTIDLLEDKEIRSGILYWVNAGIFGGNMTPTISSTVFIRNYNIGLWTNIIIDNSITSCTVTGPAGSNLLFGSNTYTGSVSKNSTGFIAGIFPDLGTSSTSIPAAGIYTYALSNGSSYSVDVPDQSSANTRIILPVPTITLNSNGTMKKITWVYKNTSGADISPDLISEGGVMVQYEDESSVWMKGATEYTFADQTYEWSSFYRIILAYNDIYGNHYVIVFNKS